MKVVTYQRIKRLGYEDEAEVLREHFGGNAVPINQEVADFCIAQEWCPYGAASILFHKLPGSREAFAKFARASQRIRKKHFSDYETSRVERWRALLRHARKFHGISQDRARKLAA